MHARGTEQRPQNVCLGRLVEAWIGTLNDFHRRRLGAARRIDDRLHQHASLHARLAQQVRVVQRRPRQHLGPLLDDRLHEHLIGRRHDARADTAVPHERYEAEAKGTLLVRLATGFDEMVKHRRLLRAGGLVRLVIVPGATCPLVGQRLQNDDSRMSPRLGAYRACPAPFRMANSYGMRTRIRIVVPPTIAGRNKVASSACRADATKAGLVAETIAIDCASTRPVVSTTASSTTLPWTPAWRNRSG